MDLKSKLKLLENLVLEKPWGEGYAGAVYVSVEDFNKGTYFPHDRPQLSFDPELHAVILIQGQYTIYDDNGYMDAGYDVLPRIEQLSIPANPLIEMMVKRKWIDSKGDVPCEYVRQWGRLTFDYDPSREQLDRIKRHQDLGELRPLSSGGTTSEFSYGKLNLTLTPDEEKMRVLIGNFTKNSNDPRDNRDVVFFERNR